MRKKKKQKTTFVCTDETHHLAFESENAKERDGQREGRKEAIVEISFHMKISFSTHFCLCFVYVSTINKYQRIEFEHCRYELNSVESSERC